MDEEYTEAVNFFLRIMTSDDVFMLKTLLHKINRAAPMARRYFRRHCRSVNELEEFLTSNSHLFFVENNRVALYSEELEMASQMAGEYFKEVVERNEEPLYFMTLKDRHYKNAPEIVRDFISCFYPIKEFKHFLRNRPDVFMLDKNHNVFLIEVESVAYLKRRLEMFGRENFRFSDFRGHVAQAPLHIQAYMNRNYNGDDFQIFLRRNCNVFRLSEDGCVSLAPHD